MHLIQHFANEEEMMAQINYSDMEIHKIIHATLLKLAIRLKNSFLGEFARPRLASTTQIRIFFYKNFKMESLDYPAFMDEDHGFFCCCQAIISSTVDLVGSCLL